MNMNLYLTSHTPTLLQTNATNVGLCVITEELQPKFRYNLIIDKTVVTLWDNLNKSCKKYAKNLVQNLMLTAVTSNDVTKYVLKVVLRADNFNGYYSEELCELPTEYIHYDMQSVKILAADNDIKIIYDCNDDNVLLARAGLKNDPFRT